MAITIDYTTRIISVQKEDMTLVQSTPFEIYELGINDFRLTLKDIEDSIGGIPFVDTHTHNTAVTIGGVTLARVFQIINGYTVTFEDGTYAVNLVNANSNIADVVNLNQVQVRSANSAGLANFNVTEYASFGGGVWIDVNSTQIGTLYPAGTPESPVNNLADALIIAVNRGFSVINFDSDFTFGATDNISDYRLIGRGLQTTVLTFTSGSILTNCQVQDAKCTGSQTGIIGYDHCDLSGVTEEGTSPSSQSIVMANCLFEGTTTFPSNYSGNLKILDCWSSVAGATTPIIDMGGSTADMLIRNYSGGIQINNVTQAVDISMDLNSGQVVLDSTCTSGTFTIRGVGKITDNSAGSTVDASHLVRIDAVWDELTADHTTAGTTGKALSDSGASANPWSLPVSGNTTAGSFGELVGKKLLTIGKFLGLK